MEFFSNNTKQIYKVPKALASVANATEANALGTFKYFKWVKAIIVSGNEF